jgi:unsaturated chondroitin disaccharide hydrolase
MKECILVLSLCFAVVSLNAEAQNKENKEGKVSPIDHANAQFDFAFEEIAKAKANGAKGVSPRATKGDTLVLVASKDWTSGFFPGNLWYMYELTKDKKWFEKAREFTAPLEQEKTNGTSHDMGFKIYCSFGNGYRFTKDPKYRDIMIQSARTLITRFNPKVGCIRSWDHHAEVWDFPVIIDNMMNLELLFWAFKETKDSTFYKVAVSHANTTLKNHFRPNFSSYHVIGYDTKTGAVTKRNTHQGNNDASSWARGQAWGLYAYTMCYRETGNKIYLQQAENIGNYILNNPSTPKDLVPYWDYNAPKIPNEPRDVSAATITASALYELSTMVQEKAVFYKETADKIMKSLNKNYKAEPLTNKGFLLIHSTGNLPAKSEIDVPIVYADYYYLEALLRKRKLNK